LRNSACPACLEPVEGKNPKRAKNDQLNNNSYFLRHIPFGQLKVLAMTSLMHSVIYLKDLRLRDVRSKDEPFDALRLLRVPSLSRDET